LPTTEETYLAWHEPVYYYILAGWVKMGDLIEVRGLNFWESLNIIFFLFFLVFTWLLSYLASDKNKWLALLNVFLFSIIFVGVKLSVYINNEILVHALIILLATLFIYWQLLLGNKERVVFLWSIILALAVLVKLTAIIVLLAALSIWTLKFIIDRKKYFIAYVLISIIVVTVINIPWLVYKQNNFGSVFSINLYEQQNSQNLLKSDGWQYLFKINYHIFTDDPFWFSHPQSFASIFLSDTFGDYYNLFNNVDQMNSLPASEKILVDNGRYTSIGLRQTMLLINRSGLVITLIWLIGFLGCLLSIFKQRTRIDWYKLFLIILLGGGWLALIYNNLRFPYLERGVLKAAFIYFSFPILAILSYSWWWQILHNKIIKLVVILGPLIVYLVVAWPILFIS